MGETHLKFDPILITEMKIYAYLLHCSLFPQQLSNPARFSVRMQSILDHPRTRTSGVDTRVKQGAWSLVPVSEPASIGYFISY